MPKRSVSYRIEADRAGLQLTLDETFWPDEIEEDGSSTLDFNIALILAEVRAALYVVAFRNTHQH